MEGLKRASTRLQYSILDGFAGFNFCMPRNCYSNYSNNATNVRNDVAVGTMASPLMSRKHVKPICLGSTDKYNKGFIGAGWGMKTCTEKSLDSLRKAKVPHP